MYDLLIFLLQAGTAGPVPAANARAHELLPLQLQVQLQSRNTPVFRRLIPLNHHPSTATNYTF